MTQHAEPAGPRERLLAAAVELLARDGSEDLKLAQGKMHIYITDKLYR
nr:hypothetical protein [Pseudomonas sp.]